MIRKKNIVILGSTGSIGKSSLDVVRHHKKSFQIVGLGANRNIGLIKKQIQEFSPKAVAIGDTPSAEKLKKSLGNHKTAVWNHSDGLEKLAKIGQADVIICGIVGAKGLSSLIAALKAGKTVGLANKEALIMAGDVVMALSKKHKAPIIPVDSEHSAIFQCLKGHGNKSEVKRLILTASGGPFYRAKRNLDSISVEEALDHPTWKMGSKITVDSATLMNKGLEAIEAHHLFGVPMEKISILIHPQSIVHSMVEFTDGAVLAQLSHPDMRLPIQYAMTYPARMSTRLAQLNLDQVGRLEFAKPDFSRFPCLKLALQAGKTGGTAPAVLSAANEEAVMAFLNKRISFMSIPKTVSTVLKKHKVKRHPSLKEIFKADHWAREQARIVIQKLEK